MRIAIDARKIADYGIGTYIRGLVGALSDERPDWSFVLIGDPSATSWQTPANVGWVVERAPRYGFVELLRVAGAARRVGADLFHAPHYVFPLRLPCPGVVTIHDCIHLRFPKQLPRALGVLPRGLSAVYARQMIGHACRASARVITVSAATRDDLVARLGARAASITPILNGCDAFWGRPGDAAAVAEIDRQLALPERYVLWVGNPKPHKNLPRLVAALGRVRSTHPDVRLLLVGPRTQGQAEGVRGVRAFGHVGDPQLRRLYQRATLLAIPSLYEGFGLPAIEAMAAGAPVVYGRAGGLPEAVGDAGIAVDPHSTADIATAIVRLLDSPAEADRLRQRGADRARSLTWQRSARATVAVYERAVGGS